MRRRIGRYEIVGPLGQGGQARVYEALLHGPGGASRPVALKVLDHDEGVLLREARLGGLLRHVHLVDVLEVGEDDGTWFTAMELCRDGSVGEHLPLSPRAVVEIGLQVCDALAYAHDELELVHLDLKPPNLLLDGPVVKVADLGIARAAGFAGSATPQGTPAYMAPEQRRGGTIDARTDIWALGVTLCELATGRRPSAVASVTWVDDGATPAPAPTRGEGDWPEWLRPVLERCLCVDPADRFASMDELAAALRGLVVDGPALRELVPPRARGARKGADGTNVDPEPDPFAGRVAEVDRLVARLVSAPGVVTLKGPAGVGKTRLARRVAHRIHAETGAQAWVCDLARAATAVDVAHVVGHTLGVPLAGAPDAALRQAGNALAGRGPVLVVLDGAELPPDEAGALIACWCPLAPEARLLITARSPLRVEGEEVLEIDVLPEADAASLVVARAAERGVVIAEEAARVIARRLDGLPLALELAAGRLGVLSADEVIEKLGLALLRSGRADVPERQSTLRAAVESSVRTLDEASRAALARLTVFEGAATEEAALAVLALGPLTAERLAALRDQSLVRRDGDRIRLLAPVREYAAGLLAPDEAEAARARHVEWFRKPRPAVDDLPDVEAAARHSLVRDADAAADCAVAAAGLYVTRGPAARGAALLAEVRAILPPGVRRFDATLRESDCRRRLGQAEAALQLCEEARSLAVEIGDRRREATAWSKLGLVHFEGGRPDAAEDALGRALGLAVAAGDRALEGQLRGNLALLALERGRHTEAFESFEAGIAQAKECGDLRTEANTRANLAILLARQGRTAEAKAAYERAIGLLREIGDRAPAANHLANLALLIASEGRHAQALALLEDALSTFREVGYRRQEGRVLGNLAHVLEAAGRPAEARDGYHRALSIHRETGNRRAEAIDLLNLAGLHALDGDREAERACLDGALAAARAARSPNVEGFVLASIGGLARLDGELDRSAALLDEADLLLRRSGLPFELAHLLSHRALLALARGDREAAAAAHAEATALVRDVTLEPSIRARLEEAGRSLQPGAVNPPRTDS